MTNAPGPVSVDHIIQVDNMSYWAVVHVARQLLLTVCVQLKRFAAFLGVRAFSCPAFSPPLTFGPAFSGPAFSGPVFSAPQLVEQ